MAAHLQATVLRGACHARPGLSPQVSPLPLEGGGGAVSGTSPGEPGSEARATVFTSMPTLAIHDNWNRAERHEALQPIEPLQ